MVTIRAACEGDLDAIGAIYNEAVLTTTATFDIEPRTPEEQRAWFDSRGPRHPILVAEVGGEVVGWACLSRWSDRPAYDDTTETSFYVAASHRGQGIGRALKESLIVEARRLGFHTLIARVAAGSDASLHLNMSLGFELVGTLREVGLKFGRRLDVHILQLVLE
jgi:phosphinothricin acetyltransferase